MNILTLVIAMATLVSTGTIVKEHNVGVVGRPAIRAAVSARVETQNQWSKNTYKKQNQSKLHLYGAMLPTVKSYITPRLVLLSVFVEKTIPDVVISVKAYKRARAPSWCSLLDDDK